MTRPQLRALAVILAVVLVLAAGLVILAVAFHGIMPGSPAGR